MSKIFVMVGWDEVPHLTKEAKEELKKSIPAYQLEARSKGIPIPGSGAIYPIPEADITVPPMIIPSYWPQAYALDVGWNRTAAIWGARDNRSGIIYLHSEYYRGQAEPSVHALGIKARGEWIPGVIDPAARGRSQRDGKKLIDDYRKLGLDLEPARNAVEAGIYEVWQLLSSGKLKVFSSCTDRLSEYRIYQRDKDGKIIKAQDHLMDCTKYLALSGRNRMIIAPVTSTEYSYDFGSAKDQSWMN